MTGRLRSFWQALWGPGGSEPQEQATQAADRPMPTQAPAVEIAPNDPLVAYFQSAPSVVEVERLNLDSQALKTLKVGGVKLAVPLVSQGELIGLINLGPRLSEQDYSADDGGLLNNLSSQASPALRVAQLVRQQQAELQARERLEHELRVARLIQQTLLPKELPALPGWQVAAYYQPARAVGGDFYDFLHLAGGRLGLIVGDVTDKGVPAALVMATTRAILRGTAQLLDSPGEVLGRANDLLCPDMPPNMFVTCLYAILDPASGHLRYANAGHDLPYWRRKDGRVAELHARGMPLGLLPGMDYEEKQARLEVGESVLLYSDGLVEAHNPRHEMFSFPRLAGLVASHPGGAALIEFLMAELAGFTGAGWEQEDDVTLVTLQRTTPVSALTQTRAGGEMAEAGGRDGDWRTLAEFSWPSERGNERLAMEQAAEAVRELHLPPAQLERFKTAVSEAAMNAMEHGNRYRPDLLVLFDVRVSDTALSVRITDRGGGKPIPEPYRPNLEAKLAGLQSPRGWGLFLIEKMVDEMHVYGDDATHTIELIMHLKGAEDGSQNA